MPCGDDSMLSAGLNVLSVFMAVLLLKEVCVLWNCLLFVEMRELQVKVEE